MAVGTKADAKPEELRGTLPAGTRLRNYELISVLGHGGFGITYYARDTTLGREVAVKEYLPTSLALRENGATVVPRSTQLAEDFIWGRERFLEEARILATLEGVPSIVRVYDYLEANGTAYMVMGLARGETLDQRLKRDKQLAPAVVERMLERLLGGLEEVHKAGFLHRDVKPANIILDAKDNPTLIDFGASRAAMADRTAAMTAIFTPRYAAAEQLTSDKQGPWTDIYSISATLYHSITGRPPPSSLERALNDTYEPLAGLSLAGYSAGTLQGIDAGLALRAKDRPQSIAVWRDVLSSTDASDGDATVVRRVKPSPAPKTPGPAPKTPGPAPKTAAPRTPPSVPSEPSRLAVAVGSAGTSLVSALGFAIAGKNRVKLYAGVMAAILVLAAGGYLVFATKPAPSPAPFGRDEAAKAQAERQRADEQAAKQKAEAEAQQKAAAAAQQKADAEARQKAAAEAQQKAAAEARQKAAAEAQQKAAAEAQQKAASEAQQKAAAEAQQKAAAEAQQKAAAEAQQKAAAEAQQKAAAEAQQKAAAEAQQKAAAEAQQKAAAEAAAQKAAEAKAAAEAQQKAAAEAAAQKAAEAKAAAEAQQKAAAEAQQKAAADAAAQKAAEAAETALHLSVVDRQRIQVALTSLGFDTHGADGVFGPRSREMITDWQRARNQPATGFLIAAQQQALLSDAAPALAKYDDEQKKAEEARRKEEAAARARAAASPAPVAPNPPSYPRNASGGVSCQDSSGRRIEFPGASSCPYGLMPAR
jgi:serine/threonine protein kinase/peptidoglycan hydrolase-like protein with peptidoglycan-binding domain